MPKFDDPTPLEIRKIIAYQIQKSIEKSDQNRNRIIGFDKQEKVNELREEMVNVTMIEEFELAWFDNIHLTDSISKNVAWEWFRAGYESYRKRT